MIMRANSSYGLPAVADDLFKKKKLISRGCIHGGGGVHNDCSVGAFSLAGM